MTEFLLKQKCPFILQYSALEQQDKVKRRKSKIHMYGSCICSYRNCTNTADVDSYEYKFIEICSLRNDKSLFTFISSLKKNH